MHRLTLTACLLLGVAALAACKSEAAPDPLDLLGLNTEWTVTEIAGTPVPEGVTVSILRPDAKMIAGSSGCNRYTGPARVEDGKIHIGALAGTRMMCPDPQMQTETAFHSTIGRVTGAQETGSEIALTDASGAVVIRARK